MAGAGLPIDAAWEVTGDFTAHGGLSASRALLTTATLPTALFAASDEMAIGATHPFGVHHEPASLVLPTVLISRRSTDPLG